MAMETEGVEWYALAPPFEPPGVEVDQATLSLVQPVHDVELGPVQHPAVHTGVLSLIRFIRDH